VGSNTALGTGAVTLAGGTVLASAALTGASAISNALTISGSPLTFGGSNAIEFSGSTTLTSAAGVSTLTLTVNNSTTLSGAITGTSGNPLVVSGIGTLTLSNAGNSFAGGVTLNAATAGA